MKQFQYFYLILFTLSLQFSFELKGIGQANISGVISNITEDYDKIYLLEIRNPKDLYNGSQYIVIDTSTIEESGRFYFDIDSLFLGHESLYRLNLVRRGENPGKIIRDYANNNYIFVSLNTDTSNVQISASLPSISKSYEVMGSETNRLIANMRDLELPIYQIAEELLPKFTNNISNDEKKRISKEYRNRVTSYLDSIYVPELKILVDTATSPTLISLGLMNMIYDSDFSNDVTYCKNIFNSLPSHVASHPYINWIANEIWILELLNSYQSHAVPDISGESIEGETLNLQDIKSSLILLDFWASWCGPCRKKNVKVYNPIYSDQKTKKLNVFAVSIDDDRENWKTAIKKDKTEDWQHIIITDKNKRSKLMSTYKIDAIPASFLLNAEYKLLKINPTASDINNALKSVEMD